MVLLMQVLETYLAFQQDAQILSSQVTDKTLEIMQEMREIALAQKQKPTGLSGPLRSQATQASLLASQPSLHRKASSVMDSARRRYAQTAKVKAVSTQAQPQLRRSLPSDSDSDADNQPPVRKKKLSIQSTVSDTAPKSSLPRKTSLAPLLKSATSGSLSVHDLDDVL